MERLKYKRRAVGGRLVDHCVLPEGVCQIHI
jgi:hypothetical protein